MSGHTADLLRYMRSSRVSRDLSSSKHEMHTDDSNL
jgi:hypothetical protein